MYEYNMSKTMADEILKARKGKDRNIDKQKYLCQYVNETCGLRLPVTKVYTTL